MTRLGRLAWQWAVGRGNLAEAIRLLLEREGTLTTAVRVGTARVTFTCDPAVARDVLSRDFVKLPYEAHVLGPVMGGGSILLEGDAWSDRRQAIAGAFAPELMGQLASHARAVAAERCSRWSGIVNVSHEMRALVTDVMTRFFGGGAPLGTMAGEATADQSACIFARLEQRLEARILDPLDLRGRISRVFGLPGFSDAAAAERSLSARLTYATSRNAASSEPGRALSARLTASEAGRELLTLVAAGATSGHHLTWTCALLAGHPDAQRAARDEAIAGNGSAPDPATTPTDDRPWISAVLNETLRLYPPAPLMFRMRRTPREFVVISLWAMQRHPSFWTHPAAFMPDRWIGAPPSAAAFFLPYGLGPRVCIGRRFSQVLAREALSEILRQRVLEPGPHPPRRPRTHIMTRPHADIFVRVGRQP